MALTKISRGLLNTGVSDSSDATAITIDSSENVGIGVTTPFSQTQITETGWSSGAPYGTVLTVTGNNTNDANWGHLLITDSSTGTGNGGMLRFAVGSTSSDISPHSGIDGFTEGSNYGGLKFLTRPNGGTSTERMRIDSSGSVLIGSTTSIASNIGLQVTGTDAAGFISLFRNDSSVVANDDLGGILFYGNDNNATTQFAYMRATAEGTHADGDNPTNLRFGTTADNSESPTERMRIDSSGNLLIGTTSSSIGSGVGVKIRADSSTAPYMGIVLNTNSAAHGNYMHYNLNATYNGYRFYVFNNGGIANYQANNSNLSDERVKTNIELSGNYLQKICDIPVKLFNYKDEPEDKERSLGVIAQDVEAVAPELINNEGFGDTPEDGVPLKTVYTTDMMYALMKSIQELSAKVEELESKINE